MFRIDLFTKSDSINDKKYFSKDLINVNYT